MPLGNWNVEFLNLNANRKYPLADEATGVDDSGAFTLPDDFLVELDLPIHAGLAVDPGRFFIKHIGVYATGFSVVVGYQPAAGDAVNVATALIDRQSHRTNTVYALGGISPYHDSVGKLVIGKLANIDRQPPGYFTFTLDTARLETDAIRPMLRGVSALYVVNNEQRSIPLYGDIELEAGANCQLVLVQEVGANPLIKVNFVEGEGTIEDCVCPGDLASAEPIRTINGVPASSARNINILGSDCIDVVPVEHGVRIVNTCAKPCCHCSELEKVTDDLVRLNQSAANVEDFGNRLRESVDYMSTVVLSSRLRDQGCVSC